MNTRELIAKMPANVMSKIESLRASYKRDAYKAGIRLAGYVDGLRDAGLITERERMMLFCYGTI